MTIHDSGDAPRRLAIRHDRGGMIHSLDFVASTLCFITSNARAEGDEDALPASNPGREIPSKCAACGVQNEDDAKHCKGCGASMATEEAPPSSEAPSSKDPPSSESPDSDKAKAKAAPPAKMSATASLATILGAETESPLGLKTAAIKLRQEHDWLLGTLAGLTGRDTVREAIGASLAIPGKLAAGKKVAQELATLRGTLDAKERTELATRLAATGIIARKKIYADIVTTSGVRTGVRVRTRYATMDLDVLRGLVTDLEGDAPKKRRVPFEADPTRAAEAARNPGHGDQAARVVAMTKSVLAQRMFAHPNNTRTIEQIAEALVRNEDAQRVDGGSP